MLDYSLYHKNPLIDSKKGVFTRGQYEFRSVEEVAEKDPGYLVFLANKAKIDSESVEYLESFIDQHPDYFEEVER